VTAVTLWKFSVLDFHPVAQGGRFAVPYLQNRTVDA